MNNTLDIYTVTGHLRGIHMYVSHGQDPKALYQQAFGSADKVTFTLKMRGRLVPQESYIWKNIQERGFSLERTQVTFTEIENPK